MISYVNGFMIQPERQRVLFIQKNRPAFQAGKWNGIGGKIESGESAIDAMVREFREETGVITAPESWERTITLQGRDFVVHFYRAFVNQLPPYATVTDERVQDWPIEAVFDTVHGHEGEVCGYRCPTLDNMKWILPMQLNMNIKFPLLVNWQDSH